MSRETLRAPFFDDLWPLILDWNRCATDYTWTKGTTEFYEPQRNFDHLAAHEYLARHGYEDYMLPENLSCFHKTTTSKSKNSSASSSSILSASESQAPSTFTILPEINMCKHKWFGKRVPRPAPTLSRVRVSCINYLQKQRNLLKEIQLSESVEAPSKNFDYYIENAYEEMSYEEKPIECPLEKLTSSRSERSIWLDADSLERQSHTCLPKEVGICQYMCPQPAPCREQPKVMENKFVKSVYDALLEYDCKCMFINLGAEIDITEMARWLELSDVVKVIVLTTCPNIANQVRLLGRHSYACLIDMQLLSVEVSYQNFLEYALNCALTYAREQDLMKFNGELFIFVFAENRLDAKCNTFCVMKRI